MFNVVAKIINGLFPRKEKAQPAVGNYGDGCIALNFGNFVGHIHGGPFMEAPHLEMPTVKMAQEISAPCSVDAGIPDFSTPTNYGEFKYHLLQGLIHLKREGQIYVGCMGGTGRTGLYMAGLVKVADAISPTTVSAQLEGAKELHPQRAINFVRTFYKKHAVETRDQATFIQDLDVSDLAKIISVLD